MSQRKVWTVEEDEALKKILSDGVKKWNSVAEAMERDYKIYGRTGKQCRERWHNQLDPKINNASWTPEEEKTLFKLHNQIGNSWAKISSQFKGRTDNAVKNHFYSTLRKAFRRLNRHVGETKAQKNRELKTIVLTKLLAATEDKFDRKLHLPQEVTSKSNELKNRLIELSRKIDNQKEQPNEMNNLIDELHDFTKSWKRKKKKGKRSNEDYGEEESEVEMEKESSPPPVPLKRVPSRIKEPFTVPQQKFVRRISSRLSMKNEEEPQQIQPMQSIKPLISRQSSKKQSITDMFVEPQYMYRLRSNPSYILEEDDVFMFKKRSSNKSFSSFLGGSLFPRISQQESARAGFSLTDSNNIGTRNLFELSDFPVEKLT